MNKFFKILLGNALILLILLAVVEIFLQIADIGGYGSAPLNPDPVFHHVHPANYRFISYSSTHDFEPFEVSYDENGLIGRSGLNENKATSQSVAFMGDSFVESNQVKYDSSFIGRLQAQYPAIDMLNYGVSSYSPSIHYLVAKHKILKTDPLPSKVFLMLYSNDTRDDETYLADAKYDQSNDLVAIDGGSANWFVSALRRFHLFRLLRKTQVALKFMFQNKTSGEAKAVVGDYLEENPDWEGTKSAEYVLKTARLLEARGVQLYLTVVPSKYNHYFRDYKNIEFSGKVEQWAKENAISFIDLTGPFREWAGQHSGSLFFDKDIHFNPEGHRIVAYVFSPYLAGSATGFHE